MGTGLITEFIWSYSNSCESDAGLFVKEVLTMRNFVKDRAGHGELGTASDLRVISMRSAMSILVWATALMMEAQLMKSTSLR